MSVTLEMNSPSSYANRNHLVKQVGEETNFILDMSQVILVIFVIIIIWMEISIK